MHTNGDGSRSRKSQDRSSAPADFAYEADTEGRSRTGYRSAGLHPQNVPLLGVRSDEVWDGLGYGATTMMPPSGYYPNYNPSAPPHRVFYGPPPTATSSYGQPMYQAVWHQQNLPPPPPLPPQPHPFFASSPQRVGSSSPKGSNQSGGFDAYNDFSLVYSDEEPSPITSRKPPIREFSTSTSSQDSKPLQQKVHESEHLIALPQDPNFEDMQEELASTFRTSHIQGPHRRNNSDFLYGVRKDAVKPPAHRRTSSGEVLSHANRSPLPLHPSQRKTAPTHSRSISFSGPGNAPRHHRGDSISSVVSMASVLSEKSIVSDISKSALYKDIESSGGKLTFEPPFSHRRLVTEDQDLTTGYLYWVSLGDDEEARYVQYTMQSDENLADFFFNDGGCGCECSACVKCRHKWENMLYPARYVHKVDESIYKRVLTEISDSRRYPCGLYFCGHHDDVDRPSVLIAVGILASFLGGLLLYSFFNNGA